MADQHGEHICRLAAAVEKNLLAMGGLDARPGSPEWQDQAFISAGLAVIIGITGRTPGRIVIDVSLPMAEQLSALMNGEANPDQETILDTLAEFGNIVSGHAITQWNNANQESKLMLTPPSVFLGKRLTIVSPKLAAQCIRVETGIGCLLASVGVEGGK